MSFFLRACFLQLIPLGFIAPAFSQLRDIRDEISKIIRYESNIDFDIVPGLVVGLWDQSDTAFYAFGQGVSTGDWFEMGSLTKPVTAHFTKLALAELGYEPSTTLCTFLPDSLCEGRWKEITIEQIIQHQTGLPRQPGNMGMFESSTEDPYRHYDEAQLISDIKSTFPSPGRYSYSHLGYAALEWVFNKVDGMMAFADSYLSHSDREMRWELGDELITQGYGFDGRPAAPWHTNAMQPALGLKATIAGMMQFIIDQQAVLALQYPSLSADLKKELTHCMRIGAYKVEAGWFLIRSGKSLVFYHNGRTGGHQVSVAFMPSEQKGAIVFANGTAGSNDLSLSLLTMLRRAKKK